MKLETKKELKMEARIIEKPKNMNAKRHQTNVDFLEVFFNVFRCFQRGLNLVFCWQAQYFRGFGHICAPSVFGLLFETIV